MTKELLQKEFNNIIEERTKNYAQLLGPKTALDKLTKVLFAAYYLREMVNLPKINKGAVDIDFTYCFTPVQYTNGILYCEGFEKGWNGLKETVIQDCCFEIAIPNDYQVNCELVRRYIEKAHDKFDTHRFSLAYFNGINNKVELNKKIYYELFNVLMNSLMNHNPIKSLFDYNTEFDPIN